MKVCCISDLHGHLPIIPECDLVLIGGDIVPLTHHKPSLSVEWFKRKFNPWLKKIKVPVVGVAGNHDLVFENRQEQIPEMDWIYLQDSGTEVLGLKIWGTPWQPRFCDWAFNAEEHELHEIWDKIPEDTDVMLLHAPPYMYGDFAPYSGIHVGSPSLLNRIQTIKPKLVVSGHVHPGYGVRHWEDTIIVNASHVNEGYVPVNPPVIVEL